MTTRVPEGGQCLWKLLSALPSKQLGLKSIFKVGKAVR